MKITLNKDEIAHALFDAAVRKMNKLDRQNTRSTRGMLMPQITGLAIKQEYLPVRPIGQEPFAVEGRLEKIYDAVLVPETCTVEL